MAQRRPPTDTEPLDVTDEQINAFERRLKADSKADGDAIALLYGSLPEWLPEPIMPQIRQALASLRNAGQSLERIAEIVTLARDNQLEEIPGTVLDVVDFLKSANLLANVQWALSLRRADAIKELGGSSAEIGDRTRTHLRKSSASGNAKKKLQAQEKAKRWLEIGGPLRLKYPEKSDSWLAKRIYGVSGDSESTIRSALARLNLQKKKSS